jgi:hypothetical protein
MLPILPIFPKKMVLFAKMLSNSIKNASDPVDSPVFSPQTIREPQTPLHDRADPFGAGSSGSYGAGRTKRPWAMPQRCDCGLERRGNAPSIQGTRHDDQPLPL